MKGDRLPLRLSLSLPCKSCANAFCISCFKSFFYMIALKKGKKKKGRLDLLTSPLYTACNGRALNTLYIYMRLCAARYFKLLNDAPYSLSIRYRAFRLCPQLASRAPFCFISFSKPLKPYPRAATFQNAPGRLLSLTQCPL